MFIPSCTLRLHNTYHNINGISLGYNLTTPLIVCRMVWLPMLLDIYRFMGNGMSSRVDLCFVNINNWRKSMSGRVSQGEAPERTWCVSGREQSIMFGRMALGSGSFHFKINDGVFGQSKSVFTDVDCLSEEFLHYLRRIVWLLTHCMTYIV